MLSRSNYGRRAAQQAVNCRQCLVRPAARRGLVAPASGPFAASEVAGVKLAARDSAGPASSLTLVARAGTRYQPAPGLTEGLERFAFRNTSRRTTLRIVREVELLGAELETYHNRENIVLRAKFFRHDLPYFAELFAETLSSTKYVPHIYEEDVKSVSSYAQQAHLADAKSLATDAVYSVAFHRGLGSLDKPFAGASGVNATDADAIAEFASAAYSKSNIALVAESADEASLAKWVGQFFPSVQTSSATLSTPAAQYYGGEERLSFSGANAYVIAFPGSGRGAAAQPEAQVLAALLGGQPSIKWSTGSSLLAKAAAGIPGVSAVATNSAYADAGLLSVTLSGSASGVAAGAKETVAILKAVASGGIGADDLTRAVASAKFTAAQAAQGAVSGAELVGTALIEGGSLAQAEEAISKLDAVSVSQVQAVAQSILSGKASVAAVGDLSVLPFAEEIGLTV